MIRKFLSLLLALLVSILSTNATFAASYPSPPSQTEDAAVSGGGNLSPSAAERQDSNDTARTNADGDSTQLTANKFGNLKVQIEPSAKQTYVISSPIFTPPASATDFWTVTGSGIKTVKILRIELNYITTSNTASNAFYLIKRSTADSGGTSSTVTAVPLDSSNNAATCTVRTYTANPASLGTSTGQTYCFNTGGTVANGNVGNNVTNRLIVLYDHLQVGQPITLRGTGEVLALNNNGQSLANSGTLSVTVFVTEE